MIKKLNSTGMTLANDAPVEILNRSAEDGPLVEAPMLIQPFASNVSTTSTSSPESGGGPYILFYSSGCTQTSTYTLRYAVSSSLYGPYTRASAPLLKTGRFGLGPYLKSPGSVSVAQDPETGKWKMAFHARRRGRGEERAMYTREVEFVRREKDSGEGAGVGGVEVRIL
jgi:hypothetical protein